jgi:hypothetical protein
VPADEHGSSVDLEAQVIESCVGNGKEDSALDVALELEPHLSALVASWIAAGFTGQIGARLLAWPIAAGG